MMLSTPETRFSWAKRERISRSAVFRGLLKRFRRPQRVVKEREAPKWKPAPWTPWLWMK